MQFTAKAWRISAVSIGIFIVIVSFASPITAVDLVRSFINGESNIGFWVKHGWRWNISVAIAIACSTYDIFSWFVLFTALKRLYERARPLYDALVAGRQIELLNGRADWMRKACRIGLRIYLFCVPQPSVSAAGMEHARKSWASYACLLFYGFTPSCIWTGVGYAFSFRLNLFLAFLVLSFANAIKMFLFGALAIAFGAWSVAIFVAVIPLARWCIEKYIVL